MSEQGRQKAVRKGMLHWSRCLRDSVHTAGVRVATEAMLYESRARQVLRATR